MQVTMEISMADGSNSEKMELINLLIMHWVQQIFTEETIKSQIL